MKKYAILTQGLAPLRPSMSHARAEKFRLTYRQMQLIYQHAVLDLQHSEPRWLAPQGPSELPCHTRSM